MSVRYLLLKNEGSTLSPLGPFSSPEVVYDQVIRPAMQKAKATSVAWEVGLARAPECSGGIYEQFTEQPPWAAIRDQLAEQQRTAIIIYHGRTTVLVYHLFVVPEPSASATTQTEGSPFKTLSADQTARLMRCLRDLKEAIFFVGDALAEPDWLKRLEIGSESVMTVIEDAGWSSYRGTLEPSEIMRRFIAAIGALEPYHPTLHECDGQFLDDLTEANKKARAMLEILNESD